VPIPGCSLIKYLHLNETNIIKRFTDIKQTFEDSAPAYYTVMKWNVEC